MGIVLVASLTGRTASPHFSQRDYIESGKPREYFHLDDPGAISLIATATDRQLDADCSDSALHEPIARFAGVAIPSLPIRQITPR